MTICLNLIINTDAVRAQFPTLSQSPREPTPIPQDMGFMVVTGATTPSGQGSDTIRLEINACDIARFFATSGSYNFEDAVLLYGLTRANIDEIAAPVRPSIYRDVIRPAVVPDSMTSPLPAQITDEEFWFDETLIDSKGTFRFAARFALYIRDDTGQPALAGYFAWSPTIEVTNLDEPLPLTE